MDDIYGDLENYNDVNAIDELRKDNEQLKIKVAEHEEEIAKLQKRVNFLETEHTRINANYSSLLKTARAEIERKSHIIATLNQEKDIMVLNSLKNSDKSLLNIRKNLLRNNHINNIKSPKIPKEPDFKKSEIESDGITDKTHIPSVDTAVTRGSFDEITNHPGGKKADSIHGKLESKENRAQGIRNRRKSMPVSRTTLYTSDEENGSDKECRADRSRENKKRQIEKDTKHKVSETSGIDDKYSSHRDSSRDTDNKSRTLSDRQMRDKYRPYRDNNHDPRRRRESPERWRPKEHLERNDGRHRVLVSPPGDRRHEHRRARVRQSDRNKPYDRSRSRHDNRPPKHKLPNMEEPISKRTRTDPSNRLMEDTIPKQFRTDDDRQTEEPISKPRTEYHIRPSDQHEQLNKYETSKQARTDSSNIITEEPNHRRCKIDFSNELTGQRNKNEMSKQANDYGEIDKVAEDKRKISEDKMVNLNLHEDSCMSPDNNLVEVTKNVPREIKLTSSFKLDDPRLKSSKYIMKTDSDKKILSTAVGRNVGIKKIDRSTWNIPEVPLPEALRKPPEGYQIVQDMKSKYYDNLVKDVYLDIDTPISNLVDVSMESGEIHSDTNDTPYTRAVAASFFAEYDNISNQTKSDRFSHTQTDTTNFDSKPQSFPGKIRNNEDPSIKKPQCSTTENISRTVNSTDKNKHITSYKIPKKSDQTANTKEYHEDMRQAQSKEKIKNSTEKHSPATPATTSKIEAKFENSKDKNTQINNKSHSASINSNSSTLKSNNESLEANTSRPKIILKLSELKGYRKLSPREIVAGDLELSDDTNDFSFTSFSRKESNSKKIHYNDEKANTNTKDLQSETVDHHEKLNADLIDNDKKEKRKYKKHKKRNKTKDSNKADISNAEQKSADKIAGTNKNTKDEHQPDFFITNNKTSFGTKTQLNDLHDCSILNNSEDNTQKTQNKEASTEVDDDKRQHNSKNRKTNKSETRKSEEKLKFTELFGDSLSCSLLTPEDLGLNVNTAAPSDNYVPICEDAQDAIQIDAQYDIPKTSKDKNVEKLSTTDSKATFTIKEQHSEQPNQVPQTKKLKDLDVKAKYENLFPGDEDTKDTEVVKTVILATGSQPRHNHKFNSTKTNTNTRVVDNVIETNSLPNLQDIPLHALATSTPCKPLTLNAHENLQKLPSVHETPQKATEQETSQKLSSFHEPPQKLASLGEITETSSNTSSLACSRSSTVDQSSILSMQESDAPVRIVLKRKTGKRR